MAEKSKNFRCASGADQMGQMRASIAAKASRISESKSI
jgi:hypothetical protein